MREITERLAALRAGVRMALEAAESEQALERVLERVAADFRELGDLSDWRAVDGSEADELRAELEETLALYAVATAKIEDERTRTASQLATVQGERRSLRYYTPDGETGRKCDHSA